MEQALSFISMLISLFALFLSIFSFWQSRASATKEFFVQGDSVEMKQYRKAIYDIYNLNYSEEKILEELKLKTDEISHVVSFYDFWALMVKKKYLPKWTFQASSKYTMINVYNKIKPYIEYRRLTQPEYASHFEWLVNQSTKSKKRSNCHCFPSTYH